MYPKIFTLIAIFLFNGLTGYETIEPPKPRLNFHHSLLSQWKETTDEQDVKQIEGLFIRLSKEIKGLDDVQFRKLTEGQFEHQTTLRFSSKEALESYENHPLHDSLRILAGNKVQHVVFFNYWE